MLGQVRLSGVFHEVGLLILFILFFRLHRCITGSVSARFARGEQTCLENCVNRFYDTSLILVNRVEAQRAHRVTGNDDAAYSSS